MNARTLLCSLQCQNTYKYFVLAVIISYVTKMLILGGVQLDAQILFDVFIYL